MKNRKILLVYFSRADENYNIGRVEIGNTEILANNLVEKFREKNITVDTFKIIPKEPYPECYDDCIARATKERINQERPEYIDEVSNWSDYDTIILGYPIWWSDMPMCVYRFLEQHDFQGKTVFPFHTHESSGSSETYRIIEKLLAGAKVVGDAWNTTGIKARKTQTADLLFEAIEKALH